MVACKVVLCRHDTLFLLLFVAKASVDIPKQYRTRIVESFLNEQKPSDGEIFRKIRLYHRQKDEEAENRWWACLDKSKLRDLRQVLKKKKLAAAFDALLDMPGLWARIHLGALQRLLALKCDEASIPLFLIQALTFSGVDSVFKPC